MLYHEIAVDPNALTGLNDLGLLDRMFGYEHGRLIALMPSKPKGERDWPTLLYERLKKANPGKSTQIELKIKELLQRRCCRSRNQSALAQESPWSDLADSEHAIKAFSSILCAEEDVCEHPNYSFQDLYICPEGFPQFLKESIHVGSIMKDPISFLGSLRPLICNARRLYWIDAYFDPTPKPSVLIDSQVDSMSRQDYVPTGPNIWLKSFKKLAHELREQKRTIIDIEIHTKTPKGRNSEEFAKASLAELTGWLPKTTTFRFCAWTEKPRGQRFHARYFLTDKGGVGIEYGTDMRKNQRTDVSLLPPAMRQLRIDEFSPESDVACPYDLGFSLTAKGTR